MPDLFLMTGWRELKVEIETGQGTKASSSSVHVRPQIWHRGVKQRPQTFLTYFPEAVLYNQPQPSCQVQEPIEMYGHHTLELYSLDSKPAAINLPILQKRKYTSPSLRM